MRATNGDTDRKWPQAGADPVVGIGSFHKTLPHNEFGEVDEAAFQALVAATRGETDFACVPAGTPRGGTVAQLTNPQAGLAADQLTHHPAGYAMPAAPSVASETTAAEMTELYWMAILRDVSFDGWAADKRMGMAVKEINQRFFEATQEPGEAGRLQPGIDIPGSSQAFTHFTPETLFRLGLAGEDLGPMVSQFFLRPVAYGTQSIDQRQRPYKTGRNFLTAFPDWLATQHSGRDENEQAYGQSNEHNEDEFFESPPRYISTMRDLARFVNKDALHQAYFNAALLLLSGGASWTPDNPYGTGGPLEAREAGFGTLGGPHILALVSEVATRALKVAWNQKWQVHLRLRPEVYGGRVHVQAVGVPSGDNLIVKRAYCLPGWVSETKAAELVLAENNSYLLPMAFTAGSPTHPAYGAGHATVAGACVTVLKAYFRTLDPSGKPIGFNTLVERESPLAQPAPGGPKRQVKGYLTGVAAAGDGRITLTKAELDELTIEGELNKLAQNVAMGRSMGGVHWRTDNTRSLVLGEAIAAEILADISLDLNERPGFAFRTFARRNDGAPKLVEIRQGRIYVDGVLTDTHASAL